MRLHVSRRAALLSAAVLPMAAAVLPGVAAANAPAQGTAFPDHYRFPLGAWEGTVILAASSIGENPQETFGLNASAEDFAALSLANAIPADRWRNTQSPILVNTGEALILFDTGLTPAAITGALDKAGLTPQDIDIVVLTHMHRDHIGGLIGEGTETFPNARYFAGKAEYDYWTGSANPAAVNELVTPLEGKITFIGDGDTVVPGITAELTAGHTPGHLAFRVENGGKVLLIGGDITNHYVWSIARPDWHVRFDTDKEAGAATRRKVFARLAEEGIPYHGYHLPFPGLGYVVQDGESYRFLPVTYQLMLDQA